MISLHLDGFASGLTSTAVEQTNTAMEGLVGKACKRFGCWMLQVLKWTLFRTFPSLESAETPLAAGPAEDRTLVVEGLVRKAEELERRAEELQARTNFL